MLLRIWSRSCLIMQQLLPNKLHKFIKIQQGGKLGSYVHFIATELVYSFITDILNNFS